MISTSSIRRAPQISPTTVMKASEKHFSASLFLQRLPKWNLECCLHFAFEGVGDDKVKVFFPRKAKA